MDYVDAIGVKYTVLMFLAGLIAFAVTTIVVARGRSPMAAVAVLLAVPLPLLVGVTAFSMARWQACSCLRIPRTGQNRPISRTAHAWQL
jgi:hypothetical protein